MKKTNKTICFTGGGTLGHVKPNLYLAEELKNYKLMYIGTNGIEKDVVKNAGIEYHEIKATKLRRGKFFVNLRVPFELVCAIKQAKKILKQTKPDLVVSKGGFVALPVCIAARKLRIPIISHESDYSFGLANKIILHFSDVMCVNYEHLANKKRNIIYTGPVISNAFKYSNIKANIKLDIDFNKPTILIIGGSSGSKVINQAVWDSLDKLCELYNVIHLTGKGNMSKNKAINYNQIEITDNVPYLMSISDLVVGRAGAGVVFECAYMNKPMLLIPLQNSNSRGDQVQNAEYFYKLGCARILEEFKLSASTLLKSIELALPNIKEMTTNLKKMDLSTGKEKMLKLINEQLTKQGTNTNKG
ncbi:MAG: UDP-N-acetylglucosamine--N-acetylmuramyl-(pentapeptide) pyrophosphoryl-undecaprenol N-acetylglucosamine transferase [Clostridia bacterium]|nr:UDP-N-acetylglucosamine--N-acetylmuramyl-(pentapeptide) pyrophosphoryl-undecaprenol N-acetylglucosamine transferase [Clostridia bacterium]